MKLWRKEQRHYQSMCPSKRPKIAQNKENQDEEKKSSEDHRSDNVRESVNRPSHSQNT